MPRARREVLPVQGQNFAEERLNYRKMENYIGCKIRELRERKCLTQEELSERSLVNVRTIQRIENGEVSPRSDTISLISKALDVAPDTFFETGMKIDNTMIYIMYASGLTAFIFPVLGVIIPLVIWIAIRNNVQNANKHGYRIMIIQICWLIVYYVVLMVQMDNFMAAGDVSPSILTEIQRDGLILKGIDAVIIFANIIGIKISSIVKGKRG